MSKYKLNAFKQLFIFNTIVKYNCLLAINLYFITLVKKEVTEKFDPFVSSLKIKKQFVLQVSTFIC